jgi:dUTP pyrophosphatase
VKISLKKRFKGNLMSTPPHFTEIDIPVIAKEGVSLPTYATEGASGADVRAFIENPLVLAPGQTALVPTGITAAIPAGFEIQVRPRSGLALKHQLSIPNTPGTIDADYRGEVCIIVINLGQQPFIIEPGMRIAQLVLCPVYHIRWTQQALSESDRGKSGFGGTGLH